MERILQKIDFRKWLRNKKVNESTGQFFVGFRIPDTQNLNKKLLIVQFSDPGFLIFKVSQTLSFYLP